MVSTYPSGRLARITSRTAPSAARRSSGSASRYSCTVVASLLAIADPLSSGTRPVVWSGCAASPGSPAPTPSCSTPCCARSCTAGPTAPGIDVGPHFSIGMRRLAIIDVATGDQPLYSDDGNLALVFNGEIYNHEELRRELERAGRRFVTDHSDTEVILRGFEEWGPAVVDHLIGMFAFAISDREKAELFLARDRLGIKPLYYVDGPGGFAFAFRAQGTVPGLTRRAATRSRRRCGGSCCSACTTTAKTPSSTACKRLLPGHTMLVRPDGIVKIERYWNPAVNTEFASSRSDDVVRAGVRGDVWDRVVARHLISDVPVGVPLVGRARLDGRRLDDGAAHAPAATDLHTDGLYSFSALYPGQTIDESEFIHEVERADRQHPALRLPASRRVLERDHGVDLVPGGADDRVGAVRVLLRVPPRERVREGDGVGQRRRRAARGLHPVLPRVPHVRDRPAPLSSRVRASS